MISTNLVKLYVFVRSSARERASDARRPSGGNRQSHPVVGGIALTPRYSPRPRLDNIRPAAAPPEEPPDFGPSHDPGPTDPGPTHPDAAHLEPNVHSDVREPPVAFQLSVNEATAGPT